MLNINSLTVKECLDSVDSKKKQALVFVVNVLLKKGGSLKGNYHNLIPRVSPTYTAGEESLLPERKLQSYRRSVASLAGMLTGHNQPRLNIDIPSLIKTLADTSANIDSIYTVMII